MDPYTEFFLASPSRIVQLETIEIAHPDFSQSYFIVRNNTNGLVANLETGDPQTFDFCPVKIDHGVTADDLDYSLKITFGDLGEILPKELDRVAKADGFFKKPTLNYRAYRSDDLTAPMQGPIKLQVSAFAFTKEGAVFEAEAERVNLHKTGEIYTIYRFPMLRGFLN